MKEKRKEQFKKSVALSLAALMVLSNCAIAEEWPSFSNGSMTINDNFTTNGTALEITGAPPVPGGYVINGNNKTVTANPTADPTANPSYFINNTAGTQTTINNTNFTGGNVVDQNGGAIKNDASTLFVNGSAGQKSLFSNNKAEGSGGALYNANGATLSVTNVRFEENQSTGSDGKEGYGGAIYNESSSATDSVMTITSSDFVDNTANNYGGAVANFSGNAIIRSSNFESNHTVSSGEGGAILNSDRMSITASNFNYNDATANGGAIVNGLAASSDEGNIVMDINGGSFTGNYAVSNGGAILNGNNDATHTTTLTIHNGTNFTANGFKADAVNGDKVTVAGGAILNNSRTSGGSDGVLIIDGSDKQVVFKENVATTGGAISNKGNLTVTKTSFDSNGALNGNTYTTRGGAIYNEKTALGSDANVVVNSSKFVENKSQNGGAIYNNSDATLKVTNSTFTKNSAQNSGGAIYNMGDATIIDSNFVGNTSASEVDGGAIYGGAGSITTVIARDKNVIIGSLDAAVDNYADYIHLAGTGAATTEVATLNLSANANQTININSGINGTDMDTSIVNINKSTNSSTNYDGVVSFNSKGAREASIKNTTIALYDGMLSFAHDRNLEDSNRLNLYGGTLDLFNGELIDQIRPYQVNLYGDTNIMLDVDLANEKMDSILKANIPGGITNPNGNILNVSYMKSISEAKEDSARILFTDADELIGHVDNKGAEIVQAPIYQYRVTKETVPVGGGGGYSPADQGEYFVFNKIGNSDSIISGPVAAQAAFLLQDNLYRQSFANMDMVTLMTPEQRMAWKMRNKYANAGYHRGVYAPNVLPEERDGWFMRPFTNFENVPLKNGPKVSNVFYGTLIGGESDIVDLGKGWDGNFSFFGAYHGSHQAYNGVGIWQNGGSIGGVATAYKGNFWTGVTANVGASSAQTNHIYGSDGFPILMTGAAWKSGYNFSMANNKLILQPSYMMSYTFVNVFDYTNSAGVRVTQDPLNAIEIIPGLRLIGNLPNGWQPYLGVNMTWNIMDKTKFYANEVPLAQLSVKPYVEYGLGLQKRYGDRFTGFGQAMLRSGGRNGIAFTLGFRWALGN